MLVLFSDMRHHTRELDLDSTSAAPATRSVKSATGTTSVDLPQVHIYALEVDDAGRPTAYWQGLKSFWAEYLRESAATLDSFSILRELSAIP
jgi:hypothetical protein